MFYTVLVPSSIRADFAHIVDTRLSYSEDHNLVLFCESAAKSALRLSDEVQESVSKLVEIILWSENRARRSFCSAHGYFFEPITLQSVYDRYDLWSFDFNPNRLVSDLLELDSELRELGCVGVVHLFPFGNVSS